MNIVEIIPQLNSGGAERFTVDLCNELSKNHKVTLVIFHPIDKHGFYASEISPSVEIISMNKKRGVDIPLFFRVRKLIKEKNPDVVHTHLRGVVYSFLSVLTAKKTSFFHTVHTAAAKESGDFISRIIRKVCFRRGLVKAVTISSESKKSFEKFYKQTASMVFNGRNIPSDLLVSNAVKEEFKKFRKSPDTKVLVNLARINPVKRQPMLAKIAKQLETEGYDFTMLMIGSNRATELVNQINSYNCSNVHILGERNNPLEYLKLADSYCLCSSYEGMPISLIEAMGVGAVPVCTPVGGIVDVIKNGENGFLSSDIEEESYYNTLKTFLTLSNNDMAKLKEASLKSYAPFSMTECAAKYVSIFKETL